MRCPSNNSQNTISAVTVIPPLFFFFCQPVSLLPGMQLQTQQFCVPMCVSFGLSVSNTHVAQICGPALQQKQTAIQRGPNVHLAGTCHTDTKTKSDRATCSKI